MCEGDCCSLGDVVMRDDMLAVARAGCAVCVRQKTKHLHGDCVRLEGSVSGSY